MLHFQNLIIDPEKRFPEFDGGASLPPTCSYFCIPEENPAAMTKRTIDLGNTLVTPGALEALQESGERPWKFLRRHARCDWGEVVDEDWEANDLALDNGERLLSAYFTRLNRRIWVVTEADRSRTVVTLPEEY